MKGKAFVDTNVLLYAFDRQAGLKHDVAKKLITTLWKENRGVVSTQVLQEFTVNLQKKVEPPPSVRDVKAAVQALLSWAVVVNDGTAVLEAIETQQRYQLSFWDALIVLAANRSGAALLYSEDLNHSQSYGSIRVENPFLSNEPHPGSAANG